MKSLALTLWLVGLMTMVWSLAIAADIPLPVPAEGIVVPDRTLAQGCLAVRVQVPEALAVSGLRWYNGSPSPGFEQVLVASGAGLFPPSLDDAVALADSVSGLQEAWSEVVFSEPVASLSGSLFLILQYPPNYAPPEGVTPVGVGYAAQEGGGTYFISDDGQEWVMVSSGCQLLMDPVFCQRDPTMLEKGAMQDNPGQVPLPKEFGVFVYPNLFNPVATIDLALPKAAVCSVRIYDIRGRLVRDLLSGRVEAGVTSLEWAGRDDRGQSVSSGVYFARIQADDKTLNRRLILIK